MQSTITSLGAHYNKLALQLAQQEYLQNQEAIQRDGELKYSTIHIDHHMSDYDFDDLEALQKEYSHCSPSDIAFKLAAITLDISSLVAERSLSALKQATIRPVIPVKMEERVKKEQFPWSVVWELNPESKSDKAHLRQILTSYYKTHFFEVSKVAAKWNITHTELSFWLKNGERHSKELQLKEEILNGSGDEMLGLSTFKKMAKRTMKSKNFRPNNKWCVSFVKKYKLQNLVELPVL